MPLLLVIGLAPMTGCGGDREERGLSPAVEEAVPMDPKLMEMTEAERQRLQDSGEAVPADLKEGEMTDEERKLRAAKDLLEESMRQRDEAEN
jgi:hypothetical protein